MRKEREENGSLQQEKKIENLKLDTKTWVKISLDVLLFITAAIPVYGFYVYTITPYRRGFFCDDDTIRYPCKGNTVNDASLYATGYTLPILLIFLNELYGAFRKKYQANEKSFYPSKDIVAELCWKLYAREGIFIFGACINEIITCVTKAIIGRLRPCFLDTCRPDINCSAQQDQHVYILSYTCTNNDTSAIEDSRKSFPSGHSSFAFYTMVFLVMYLQFCMNINPSKLLKPSLQIVFIMLAWYTAMSRITDNKHHWGDVTIGTMLGIIIALGMVYVLADFAPKSFRLTKDQTTIGSADMELRIQDSNVPSIDIKI